RVTLVARDTEFQFSVLDLRQAGIPHWGTDPDCTNLLLLPRPGCECRVERQRGLDINCRLISSPVSLVRPIVDSGSDWVAGFHRPCATRGRLGSLRTTGPQSP